jgi:5-methylcytosine-specific restriction protein B
MTFKEAINIIVKSLSQAGTVINADNYDGVIIKKLAASNTLDAGRTTNQTHIAITGTQMDIFPYLCADGYFYDENKVADVDLKKYFVVRVPVTLYESNLNHLGYEGYDFSFNNGVLHTATSVVRSKRGGQADQLQVSMLDMDGEHFVAFRKLLHEGYYFVLLKHKSTMSYDAFGINTMLIEDAGAELSQLNNKFFKLPTNTVVDASAFNNVKEREIVAEEIPDDLSVQQLGEILKQMYDAAIGGKVSAIHMFGIKYGPIIKAKNYSTAEIIRISGIGESYNVEVSKGISIYKVIKDNNYGIHFVDVDVHESTDDKEPIPYAWYVGATGNDENGDWGDFSDRYITEGCWENGWDDKFVDDVNSMKVGDRIAIKAAYTKKNGLPFNNNGKVVGVMAIKAIGVITENPQDGKHIKVDWTRVTPAKEWYGAGVLRQTVHYVSSDENYTRKALLDFTFNDIAQDYSICEEQYSDESESAAAEVTQEIVRIPRINKMHPLNCILFGAPGTGKTYATAEYALAFIENREVDLSKKSVEERKTVMDSYNAYLKKGQIVFTTFHQSYGYEDFIQGMRPDPNSDKLSFVYADGVFKKIADEARSDLENNYVIIIDEINRANISKVFGELITLIEEDKREGEVNAISVVLPSGAKFSVPNNLYIIGTMNSADKSISLIDTALRRRFDFVEVIPRAEFIENATLRNIMKKLNESLVSELDSTDLLIGHSYFMGKTEADICNIMNRNIIPLLYEYFYDNSKKVKALVETVTNGLGVAIKKEAMGRIKLEKQD